MINTKIKNITCALFLSQLVLIPLIVIPDVGVRLWEGFTSAELFSSGRFLNNGIYIMFYTVLVSSFVTLIYGIPIYLFLDRYNKANLLNLIVAGSAPYMLVGPFGVFIAGAFWAVITEHSLRVKKMLSIILYILISITLGLVVMAKILDAYFVEDMANQRISRALSKKAPPPEWWGKVGTADKFKTVNEAVSEYHRIRVLDDNNSNRITQSREFFKSAYLTIQDPTIDSNFKIELVLLMDAPFINYQYINVLQEYVLFLPKADKNNQARLLIGMLNGKVTNAAFVSLAYDFLTENKAGIKPEIAAPLCSKLALLYKPREINYFEIAIFRQCEKRLRPHTGKPYAQKHYRIVKSQLMIMEEYLIKP